MHSLKQILIRYGNWNLKGHSEVEEAGNEKTGQRTWEYMKKTSGH